MSAQMPVRVTITGADDAIEHGKLVALTREFPFVEWGVLISPKRAGTPRYPSSTWLAELARHQTGSRHPVPVRLALHLCGAAARDVLSGVTSLNVPVGGYDFAASKTRIQMNGYEPGQTKYLAPASENVEFILQARSEDTLQHVANDAIALGGGACVLFDPSGGRGIEPFRWPVTPLGVRMGFAGGINPDNVAQVLADIVVGSTTPRDGFWIDMESGVRDSEDRFDLGKVRRVLETAAEFFARVDAP